MPEALRQPEYRKDPLSDAWVVIAAERSGRPEEFREIPFHRVVGVCPFCRGNESVTPAEICSFPPENRGDWKVRVVPNKFPAVVRFENMQSAAVAKTFKNGTPRLFTSIQGHGGHEVVIESSRHAISLSDLSPEELYYTFIAYRDRMRALGSEGSWKYVQVFKNVGAAAGSSIEHAHSQIMGLPTTPIRVAEELAQTKAFFAKYERSLFQVMIEEELALDQRIAAVNDHFVAICPYASRFPYETWILPRNPAARFDESDDTQAGELGTFTAELIGKLERTLHKPAYNYLLHSAPFDGSADDHYQWHLEIFPRLTKLAGFEWGTGYYINPVPPEQAAQLLRNA